MDGREEAVLEYRLRMHMHVDDLLRHKTDMSAEGREKWAGMLAFAKTLPIWVPCSEPQRMAARSRVHILGLGGSVGSGKTNCAFGMAMTQHVNVEVLRETAEAAADIVDDIKAFTTDTQARNIERGKWIFNDPKMRMRELKWRGLSTQRDFNSVVGRARDCRIYEEAWQMKEKFVRDTAAWVRTTDPDLFCRIIMTFNPFPANIGVWVQKMFAPWIDPDYPENRRATDGEVRYFMTNPYTYREYECKEGEERVFEMPGRPPERVKASSRTFIVIHTRDNPFLANVDDYRARMGAVLDSDGFRRFFKGSFFERPKDHELQVIPSEWVQIAQDNWHEHGYEDPDYLYAKQPYMCALGVDVSQGGGGDKNVGVARWGGWFSRPEFLPPDLRRGLEIALAWFKYRRNNCPVYIDPGGVGADAYNRLVDMIPTRCEGIVASGRNDEMDLNEQFYFYNYRAWLWWCMREALNPDNVRKIALPPGSVISQQLTAPRHHFQGDRMVIESKKQIRERIGHSTDVADALINSGIGFICPHWGSLEMALAEKFVPPSLSGEPHAHLQAVQERIDRRSGLLPGYEGGRMRGPARSGYTIPVAGMAARRNWQG